MLERSIHNYGTRRGKPGAAQAGYLVLREGAREGEEGVWPGGEWQRKKWRRRERGQCKVRGRFIIHEREKMVER